jgi:hypothetical protein
MAVDFIEERPEKILFEHSRLLFWLMASLIVIVGLGIRLYDLTDLPLDFHSTRQLHSALIARGMYYQNLDSAPQWQRDLAVHQWKLEGLIEPQIMERLAAWTYGLAGGAYLWIPRLYSIFFWMVGGLFLFLLAKDLIGRNGAVFALAYFLILPYGAIASRAFQPEPLLMASIIAAYWAMLRWYRCRTWKRAVLAGALAGLSIYVKATAVFFIGGAWLGLLLGGLGLRELFRTRQVWLMAALTVIPYLCYHVYGYYITGLLVDQFSLRFFPQMWLDPIWYLRWNGQISSVVGFEFFLAGILGLLTVRDRGGRTLLLGVLCGYFIYCLTFSYYVSTHDYYHEPLIPLVALGVAAGLDANLRQLLGPRWIVYPVVVGILLFAITIKGWDVRNTLKRQNFQGEEKYWQKLGQTLGQDTSVVGLTHDYGYRLAYWGWVETTNWMTTGDMNLRSLAGQTYDMQKTFDDQAAGKDYFVVTLMNEFNNQPALKKLLTENYSIYEDGGDYLIFDLHKPLHP